MKRVHKGKTGPIDRKIFQANYNRFRDAISDGMKNPNFNSPDWLLNQNLKYNAATFAAFKAHEEGSEIQKLLYDPETDDVRKWTDFRDRALQVSQKYNKRWLQTEYNHAAQASRQARKWQDFQSTKELYPNLKYVSVKDNRTRHDHRELDGAIYPIDDPFWDTYMPPNGWGCRCTGRPTDAGPKKAKGLPTNPKGFNNNPGKSGQVFPEDSAYFRKGIDKLVFNQVNKVVRPPEVVQKHYKEYQGYGENYKKGNFNKETGGYYKVHKSHNTNTSGWKYEEKVAIAQIKKGERIEFLDENKYKKKTPDFRMSGETWDVKAPESNSSNSVMEGIWDAKKANNAIIVFRKKLDFEVLYEGYQRAKGRFKKEKKTMPKVHFFDKETGEIVRIK